MRRRLAVAANPSRFNDLSQPDYFELLGLARGFDLDAQSLERSWKDRVATVHPDRFAGASDAQKRVAMQWSSQINEAYRVLRDPLKRAQYLCELAGYRAGSDAGAGLDTAFLMQQMQWRESLEELRDQGRTEALGELIAEIEQDRLTRQKQTGALVDSGHWDEAIKSLHEWMFVEKFLQELTSVRRALKTTE